MAESTEERPPQSGGENRGVDEDVGREGVEGTSAAATPPIGDDAESGQTASPAPPDDVGVPPDEEMNQPDE